MVDDAGPHQTPAPARCRKFGLSDAMILIAGVTISLALCSHHVPYVVEEFVHFCRTAALNLSDAWEQWPLLWIKARASLAGTLDQIYQIIQGCLVGMVLAFLVVRLRRPRPALGVLLRQPGTVAVTSMIFGAFWIIGLLDYLFYPTVGSGQWIAIDPGLSPGLAIGGCVAIAWTILAACRRWQPETGWIDRMGRWLGLAALAYVGLGVTTYLVLPSFW